MVRPFNIRYCSYRNDYPDLFKSNIENFIGKTVALVLEDGNYSERVYFRVIGKCYTDKLIVQATGWFLRLYDEHDEKVEITVTPEMRKNEADNWNIEKHGFPSYEKHNDPGVKKGLFFKCKQTREEKEKYLTENNLNIGDTRVEDKNIRTQMEFLKKGRWLKKGDIIKCGLQHIDEVVGHNEKEIEILKTDAELHNWSGQIISRDTLIHLKPNHIVRCSSKYNKNEERGSYYYLISSVEPLKGVFMDMYSQADRKEHLVGTEFDLDIDSITEIPTIWNPDLKDISQPKNYGYGITGVV
jgi:hypothetical protein